MKKTLLAVSIAALAAGTANAAVKIYESETGSLSSYGRIQLELQNYDGENNIQNQKSRLGFSGDTKLDNGLTAFTNFEFRFQPGVQNDLADDEGEWTVRNSYLGVKGDFGSIKAGNFDSIVYSMVTKQADIMENEGYRSLDTGSNNARGTAIAYETNDISGFKFGLGIKHYASDESAYGARDNASDVSKKLTSNNGDEVWNIQLGATYQLNDELSFGLAFDQNNEDGNPVQSKLDSNGNVKADPIIAASVEYATDTFNVGLVLESTDDVMIANINAGFSYAYGDIYGLISFMDDDAADGGKGADGIDLGVGANYKLASNFRVYGELAVGNDDVSEIQDAKGKGTTAVTLGARYSW